MSESLEERVDALARDRDRIWRLSQDLFAVVGFDGRFKTINPAWNAMLGEKAAAAALRARFVELFDPEDRPAAQAAIDAMRGGATTARFEGRLKNGDGFVRWVSWTATPAGEVFYTIGRDVTEEKLAADELEAANRQLRDEILERNRMETALNQMQRLEAVGQLTSGVAHDFNNLLTVILGNLSLFERAVRAGDFDARLTQRLGHMRAAAERGATLTAQLLAFSRRQRLEPKALDLNDTVLGMRELLRGTLGGSVRLETVLHSELWPALVDPTQIEMIILNLAINARDAMEVGGGLTIETRNVTLTDPDGEPGPGQYVMLSVADTGAGMTDEVLAKAFEPFFTTKEVGKGSGLGLAQVYGFAKQSGGGAVIDTRVGVGTVVKVYLPRADAGAGAEEADAALAGGETQTHAALGFRVLVVDDDSGVREVTCVSLQDLGYQVVEAGSGGAALDTLQRDPDFDLVLLDYAMPGMNGVDTADEIRRRRPALPILFVTGYADLTALNDIGDEMIIQKPYRDGELAAKVERALSRSTGRANVLPFRSSSI